MRAAYELASQSLPNYSCKFSRKDFTLPQLFACLAVKELMKRSYREAEALLADSESWLRDIGMTHAPDHNTLCRASKLLLTRFRTDKLLDVMAQWAAVARMLKLSSKPLAVDSSMYESHHVSRHYERRCHQTRDRMKAKDRKRGRKTSRSRTVRRLPKLAIGVCSHSHLVLSMWTGTGSGSDHPHFESILFDAWRRVPNRRFKVALDAGYDSEEAHDLARREMGLITLIPPTKGRPRKDGGPPGGHWRGRMKRLLATRESRKRCGYTHRWQSETVHSMMKRNLGSALRGKTAHSRKRDLRLKTITHDLMVF
jgi:hypothetical protein